MTMYLISLSVIILSGFASIFVSKKHPKIAKLLVVVVSGTILYLFASLRSANVGRDTIQYVKAFETIATKGWNDLSYNGMELGYVFLNKVFSSMGLPFQAFLCFVELLVYVPLCFVMYKKSENPLITIILFIALFFAFEMSGIRQSIAMSICLMAFYLFTKKKVLPMIIAVAIVIFSYFIHSSSLAFLLIFVLIFIPFKQMYLLIAIPLILLCFIVSPNIFQVVSQYAGSAYMPGDYGGGGLFFAFLLMLIFFVCFGTSNTVSRWINNKFANLDNKTNKITKYIGDYPSQPKDLFYNGAMWAFLLTAFFQSFCRANQVFPRYGFYFTIIGIICFPSAFSFVKSQLLKKILNSVLIIGLVVLFIFFVLRPNQLDIIPYQFFWQV